MAGNQLNPEDFLKINLKELVSRIEGADPGDFISFHQEKCNGCGACVLVCSAGLWAMTQNGKSRLSPHYQELCLECAACYAVCEQEAIDFRYPRGGSGIVIKYG